MQPNERLPASENFAGRKIYSDRIAVKPYCISELSKIYEVSDKTINKWLKPLEASIGEKRGRLYTVAQVELIFQFLGLPYWIE